MTAPALGPGTSSKPRVGGARWSRWLAWGVLLVGILLETAALPLALAVDRAIDDFLSPWSLAFVVVGPIWLATGALIASRQPRNWAGWLIGFIGLSVSYSLFIQPYAVYGLRVAPGSLPLIGPAAWTNEYAYLAVAFIPLLFLLFPDGRVPGPRWRWAVVGLLGGMGLAFLAFLVRAETLNNLRDFGIGYENPFGIEALGQAPGFGIAAGTILALISAVACAFGLRARFKRTVGEERQQTRWLVAVGTAAAALLTLTFTLGFVIDALGLYDDRSLPIFPIMLGLTAATIAFGVPTAFLVAIFRYHLWDLDIVIRKTVVYAVLAAFVTVVYAAIVAGSSQLVGGDSLFLSIAATATVAALFQPVRRRATRIANRLVFGRRADPYEVLAGFSERVGGTYATEDVLSRMARVIAEGVGGERAEVWLGAGTDEHLVASWPEETSPIGTADHVAAVRHGTEMLGEIRVRKASSEPITPAEAKLLDDLASQAGLVLRNVGLTLDLQARVDELARQAEELRTSRIRIVAAHDAERRRLERNIHDGAQQHLVALSVKLRLAKALAARDPRRGVEMLLTLAHETDVARGTLLDLASGIYPAVLEERGIGPALEDQARAGATAVVVETDGVGRLPVETEAAVYFVCLEAVQNAAKHARANRIDVRLATDGSDLRFEVTDDGVGFDAGEVATGSGLANMRDRLAAFGGEVDLTSTPGAGTTVLGRIPLGRETVP